MQAPNSESAVHFVARDTEAGDGLLVGHRDVGDIAWRQRKGDRSAAIIGQTMDFARSSTARRANRL